jgi:hypothetical protein
MKNLTTEQIGTVSNYILSFDIKWYELQVELTDHFVSIMEEIWNEDPALTFHQVKYRAEQRFGRNYFKEVEEKRIKELRNEHKRIQLKMVSEYLKLPKIVLSVLMVFVVYRMSFYFEDIAIYIKILFGILLGASLFTILNWYRYRKINGKRFLALETALRLNTKSVVFSYFSIVLVNSFKQTVHENYLIYLPFYLFWGLGLLLILTGYKITNKVAFRIKKQYQLT